jgi:hypothetical protein
MNPLNRKSSVSRLVNNLSLVGADTYLNSSDKNSINQLATINSTTPVMKKAYDYAAAGTGLTGRNQDESNNGGGMMKSSAS